STLTDATGAYGFTGLSAGTYTVREVLPTGWSQTAGKNPATVTVDGGTNSAGNDFGNFHAGTIAGDVFVDNKNTSPSVGPGLSGWAVQLLNGSGSAVQQATTDSKGHFSFTGLSAGTYGVREVLPAGWTQTSGQQTYTVTVTSGTRSPYNSFGNLS